MNDMRNFGNKRPVRDGDGTIISFKESPSRAVTLGTLGGNHGPDRNRRLVVSLVDGDLIEFRPYGTKRTYQAPATAVYEWLLRSQAQSKQMAKLRERKAAKQQRLADQRQRRAEKRLFRKD
jgi:hypothetical protein